MHNFYHRMTALFQLADIHLLYISPFYLLMFRIICTMLGPGAIVPQHLRHPAENNQYLFNQINLKCIYGK